MKVSVTQCKRTERMRLGAGAMRFIKSVHKKSPAYKPRSFFPSSTSQGVWSPPSNKIKLFSPSRSWWENEKGLECEEVKHINLGANFVVFYSQNQTKKTAMQSSILEFVTMACEHLYTFICSYMMDGWIMARAMTMTTKCHNVDFDIIIFINFRGTLASGKIMVAIHKFTSFIHDKQINGG